MTGKLIMLVGLLASGKDTYCKKLVAEDPSIIVVSSDDLREELLGDVNDQSDNRLVFEEFNRRIKDNLREGWTVIANATNLNAKRRAAFLNSMPRDCKKEVVVLAVPFEECCHRNYKRDRTVPYPVMLRMYKSFQMPGFEEGWDEINYINPYSDIDMLNLELEINCACPHDNPHHTLSCGDHCKEAYRIGWEKYHETFLYKRNYIEVLTMILRYHDVAKYKAKTFKSKDGTFCSDGVAHYYSHQNLSAYDYLCYCPNFLIPIKNVIIAWGIQHHMDPFDKGLWEKMKKKLRKTKPQYGEHLIELIEEVHRIDLIAR